VVILLNKLVIKHLQVLPLQIQENKQCQLLLQQLQHLQHKVRIKF